MLEIGYGIPGILRASESHNFSQIERYNLCSLIRVLARNEYPLEVTQMYDLTAAAHQCSEFRELIESKDQKATGAQLDGIWQKASMAARVQIRQDLASQRDQLINHASLNQWAEHKQKQSVKRIQDLSVSRFFTPKVEFKPLRECLDILETLAQWSEEEFGFMRQYPGYLFRELEIFAKADYFHVGFIGKSPVALFRLTDLPLDESLGIQQTAKYLSYVIVEENCRRMNIGKQLISEVKRLTQAAGAELILFTTINPNVNGFYEKHQAKIVHENMDYIPHLGKHNAFPAEYFVMDLSETDDAVGFKL